MCAGPVVMDLIAALIRSAGLSRPPLTVTLVGLFVALSDQPLSGFWGTEGMQVLRRLPCLILGANEPILLALAGVDKLRRSHYCTA